MDPMNKSSVCRLCLRKGLSLIDIFEENIEQRFVIKEAIEELLHCKVHKRLGLPWAVCPICCAKLDDFRNFKIQCLNSNRTFERKISQHVHSFEEPPHDMLDIVDAKTESQEVQKKFCSQVVYASPIQPEQEEEMSTDERGSMEMDSIQCNSERGVADPHTRVRIEGCAADFWRGTEAALEITVPKYLKNVLKMNGCDNGLSMAVFDAASQVPVLERFVREDMLHVIPLSCFKEDYYGIFERCPERFRIVDGHRKILIKIAEYWKDSWKPPEIHQRKNECQFGEDVSLKSLSLETLVKSSRHNSESADIQTKTVGLYDLNSLGEAPINFPDANKVLNRSRDNNQQTPLVSENLLGNSVLDDYCDEGTHSRVGEFYNETPSKKKRGAQY